MEKAEKNGEVIGADHLSFSYGKVPILKEVGFSIQSGDFVGIIGSNGAGKSTLLKLITGLLPPSGGSIRLFGTELPKFRDWSKIGYVPQNGAYAGSSFPATALEVVKLNLFSQIGFLRFPKRRHREQALRALRMVGMQDYAGRLIGNLSGGQMQRVLIARVLVNSPQVMLLDEPTNGMDEKAAGSLYELLQHLNRKHGITIVMVTHDVERASRYLRRVFTLGEEGLLETRLGGRNR